MPRHSSWDSIYSGMLKQYGEEKGKEVYYSYLNKHKYDDTKPRPKSKSFTLSNAVELVDSKTFYGAIVPIINVEVKTINGEENYFVEGFITAPVKDFDGETISLDCMAEWSKECTAPPHNLVWLHHDSPYKKPENIAKPAILRFIDSKISELKDRLGNKHKGLWVKGLFNTAHPQFKEVWDAVSKGFINSFSTEFIPLDFDPISKTLNKAKYLASCLVMAPSNDMATITATYAKSFMGMEIMTEKSLNMSSSSDSIIPSMSPPLLDLSVDPDSLEGQLQNLNKINQIRQGPQVPNTPIGTQPTPVSIVPPIIPPSSTPTSNPLEDKVNAILSKMGIIDEINNRLKIVETVVPKPDPDPTSKEIERVMKYLAKQPEDFYKPKVVVPKTGETDTPVSSKSVNSEIMYSQSDVDIMIREALQRTDVVRKTFNPNMPSASKAEFDLSSKTNVDEDSIEGMLTKRDRMFGIMEINGRTISVLDKR